MNPFGPSTTSELAAYHSGQWDAQSSARGEINSLVSQINALQARLGEYERYLPVITQNRDDAHKCAWSLHYQFEDAKHGIQILLDMYERAVQDLEKQRERHARTIEDWQEYIDSQLQKTQKYISFANASMAAAQCLIQAAEAGKSDREDYIEFKVMYDQMRDLWDRCYGDVRNNEADFVTRANALMESLSE